MQIFATPFATIPAMDTEYEGWFIRTGVTYDNPDEWKPGDPDRYIVRGFAEWPQFQEGAENWTDTSPITAQSQHFTNRALERRFHAEVQVKLKALVEERRTTTGW